MSTKTLRRVIVIAFVCGTVGIAAAQTVGAMIVKERQQAMKAMASGAKAIAGMFNGSVTYDGTAFKSATETIRLNSGLAMKSRFPDETLGSPFEAKKEIAADRDEFNRIADRLEKLADVLSLAAEKAPYRISDEMRMGSRLMSGNSLLGARTAKAEEDPAKMPAEHVFHLMLETCTNCHAKFRKKQQ